MLKHVGRIKKTQKKCIVAYRVVPGTDNEAVVIPTESLMAEEHDALIKLVESAAGQQSYELAEAMARTRLPDGRIMLAGFHTTGKMIKVNSDQIEMTPDTRTVIDLTELNNNIAAQKGVTVAELALKDPSGGPAPTPTPEPSPSNAVDAYVESTPPASDMLAMDEAVTTNEEVLTDEKLAAQYRSQADAMFKEAKILREQAKEITDRLKAESEEQA
jgi:hypothetical protein